MASKRNTLIALGIVLLVLGVWVAFSSRSILGDDIEVKRVTIAGRATGKGFVSIPYTYRSNGPLFIRVAIDANGDGKFDPPIIMNAIARTGKQWRETFPITIPSSIPSPLKVWVVLSEQTIVDGSEEGWQESKQIPVTVGTYDMPDLLQLASVTDPENAMKGGFAEPAAAQNGVPTNFKSDVPDITQRPAECAPTSAANNLISLAGDHGRIDALPRDPTELIDGLKGEMNWTPANGVSPNDFVKGKDRMAARLGLPIRTSIVGDGSGIGSLDQIERAIQNGGAAELRLRFTDPGGKTNGGHMVTVTGVHENFIDVNDPLSPSGTDTYEIKNDGSLKDYPYHNGGAFVSFGFVQYWDTGLTGTAGTEPLTEGELQGLQPYTNQPTVKVIDYGGRKVPLSQIYVGKGPDCDAPHWHAGPRTPVALDGRPAPDPAPHACGYGRVRDVPVEDCTKDGKKCQLMK
jgi:hypothetical protein